MNILKLKAFTLAEVLITLAVIGIVSALTAPVIVKNYRKRQFETKLKQTYSILANAKLRAEADYGPMKNWNTSEMTSREVFANKYVKPYIKYTDLKFNQYSAKALNGDTINSYINPALGNEVHMILSNGASIGFSHIGGSYEGNWNCAIFIDLNGMKKPNIIGKDIHIFYYFFNTTYPTTKKYAGKFVPMGTGDTENTIKNNCLGTDWKYCTTSIYKNNWQYPDWFPW